MLARHAESEWNANGVYQGRLDPGLSELGLRQAEGLRDRLATAELAAVYSSPLQRAWRTAEIVAGTHGLEPLARPELTDVDHGEWSGMPRTEVADRWPELYREWHEHPARVRFPGGESLLEVRDRALSFLALARQRHAEGNLLVITHGEVLQLLLAHLLEMQPDQM
ncbi:MAG TPA: histidine phosphatase family protein, partial [Chloroflexota bacterium]|nr:histidine phosphatase family protein [Chloroflexota bacterium]